MKKLMKMKKNQKGFTLVEVIVVLVILAIMAAILIPSLIGYIDKSRENSIISETRSVATAAQTLSSEAYAKYKNATISFGDGVASSSTTDADGKVTAYVVGETDITELAEVEGDITSLTITGGKVTALEYKSGDYTCAYPNYEVTK